LVGNGDLMDREKQHVSVRRFCLTGAALIVLSVGCKKNPPPPAPPPAPIVVPREDPPKKDVNLPDAPPIATKTPAEAPPPAVETKPPVIKPPAPQPRRRRNAKKAADPKPAPAAARPVEEAKAEPPAANETVAPPQTAAPQLGQMLSAQQSKEFNRKLDSTLERVKHTVAIIQTKPLNNEQKEVVGRIRNFLAQAEQAREQDLVSAVNLAERADLLSRDLLERLR
jgi:type IV secretory pathway VirB10-like protein